MTNGRARKETKERRAIKNQTEFEQTDVYENDEEEDDDVEKWPTFVCDLDDPKSYGITVDQLQEHFNNSLRRTSKYVKLVLRSRMEKLNDVSLLLEENSVYLDCLEVNNVCLEFGRNGAPLKFKKATKLGYGERYSDLCESRLVNVDVGHDALLIALRKLNRFRGVKDATFPNWCSQIKLSLATLIFMFPECFRFRWIGKEAKTWVDKRRESQKPLDWMAELIPDWSKITEVSLNPQQDMFAPSPPPLPVGDYVYTLRDAVCAHVYPIWAEDSLVVKNRKRKRDDA